MLRVAGHHIEVLGFVGLGVMGEPMCSNLAASSGLPVNGCDTRSEPLRRLASQGVTVWLNTQEMTHQCDLVFLCLANDDQVRDVCFGSSGFAATSSRVRVIVDCGTTSLSCTREFSGRAQEAGIVWVDSPVARGRGAAHEGSLLLLVGATKEVFSSLEPLLRCMGTDVLHCGDTGSGQVVKILNNKVMVQTVHALSEALAIARRTGVDGDVLFDAFSKGSADSKTLRVQGIQHLLPGNFPNHAFPTAYARKDIGLALALADEAGLDADLARSTAELLDRAIAAGFSECYYPVIQKILDSRKRDT